MNTPKEITVTHFQRKAHPYGSYSVEFIFDDVRARLEQKALFKLKIASKYSTGFWNRIVNMLESIFHQSAVNHVTGDIHYVTFFLKKKRTILTILDCVFLNQESNIKRFFYQMVWLTIPAHRVRYITAISESTKQHILRYVRINPDKIIVIPIGVSVVFTPHPKKFNVEYPTLLQVGTTPNKNLNRLIPAIQGIPCRLVIIGKMEEATVTMLQKHKIDYENRWNLNAVQMLEEYKYCDVLTFASTYEGFGMPIIEANFVERVVVAGRNSSMVEVAGDAACLVDAESIEDIRRGILQVINDETYREQLITQGRVNRMRFDPQNIAERYFDLYERTLRD